MAPLPFRDLAAKATETLHSLSRRQSAGILDPGALFGKTGGPAAGVVAGIVLGSVAGFLFICWLIMMVSNTGGGGMIQGEEEIVVRQPRSSRSRRSRGTRTVETREISRSPQRRRRRSTSGGGGTRIVEERIRRTERDRRVDGDDIVEVFEEMSEDGVPLLGGIVPVEIAGTGQSSHLLTPMEHSNSARWWLREDTPEVEAGADEHEQ